MFATFAARLDANYGFRDLNCCENQYLEIKIGRVRMVQLSQEASKARICRKCGRPMHLVAESEQLSDGSRRISYYYKCPSCGAKHLVEQLSIAFGSNGIVVEKKVFKQVNK